MAFDPETTVITDAGWEYLKFRNIEPPEGGWSIGPGWQPLVERALDDMIVAGWDRKLVQVKQKFCSLVIYVGGEKPQSVVTIIDAAVIASRSLCEHCGGPRESSPPFSRTRCSDCS